MNGYPIQQQPSFPGYPQLDPNAPPELPQSDYSYYQQAPAMQPYAIYQQAPSTQTQQPGYAIPQQPGYAPQQSGYVPQQLGYVPQQLGYVPQQSGYQQSGYAPQQPGSAIPQQLLYAHQQSGYGISQHSGYGIHQQVTQEPKCEDKKVMKANTSPTVTALANNWQRLHHHSKILNVHIGRKDHIGMIANDESMFYGKGDQWYKFDDGAAVVISASKMDSSFWCINSQDMIFRRRNINSAWELMPGRATHVSATSYDSAVVSNKELLMYEWIASQNNWKILSGEGRGTRITRGNDGSTFCIGTTGRIYEHRNGRWHDELFPAEHIDVLNARRRVCVSNGILFIWTRGYWEETQMRVSDGSFLKKVKMASISPTLVCLLLQNGDCYIKNYK